MGIAEKIADIHAEMARTQKNKATEHHLGLLKAKLAKLRSQLLEPESGSGGGKGEGFAVSKSGDARVSLIGFPSVGKSTILTKLTETESVSAEYAFTTLTAIPGNIHYKGAKLQLLDTPGIIEGAAQGRGRGKQVIAITRTADLVLMMLDASKGEVQKELLEYELESVGIRLNKSPPDITFKRKKGGGVSFNATVPLTRIDERMVKGVCQEYKIHHCEILVRCDATIDEMIDVIEGNRVYLPCLYVYNKIDTITIEMVDDIARRPNTIVISCEMALNLEYLLEKIWEYLDLIRVYTKPASGDPKFDEPLVIRRGSTVREVCRGIHRDFEQQFKNAFVWGTSAKHTPQRVGIGHVLEDEDVIQLIRKPA
mmetsp:Transcript_14970/g.42604  ORF Transcript_14970/g.42604 Transcript_14970/m.42604 type:complete len:368 (+) Transcript_14970:81-1184(+)